jgi:hypothetical protein
MFRRRQREAVTTWMLGAWLFAFALGVAHACTIDGHVPSGTVLAGAASVAEFPADAPMSPNCEKFCADDIPVLSKIDPAPDAVAIFVVIPLALRSHPAGAPAIDFAATVTRHAALPPGVPLRLRLLRLTL